jgi:hypothetical protein
LISELTYTEKILASLLSFLELLLSLGVDELELPQLGKKILAHNAVVKKECMARFSH